MDLAARLKAARTVLSLKQDELAAQSGVSYSVYQKYEMGRSIPGGEAIAGFVRLGINANWLLTGEGPMLLKDLAVAQQPKINVAALSAIVEGLIKAGAPPDKVGPTALRYYEDAIAQGLITPDGIGSGGKAAA